MLPKSKLVEIITVAFMYCIVISRNIQEEMLYHKACFQIFNHTYCKKLFDCKNKTVCGNDQNTVIRHSTRWGMYLSLAQNLPSVFVTLFFGICSDKLGRKTFLLIPIIGNIISCVTFALIARFRASIQYLFLGNFIAGFFGGFTAFLSSCFSFIADITNEENRTVRVVLLEAFVSLASIVGSISGGFIVEQLGFVDVYFILCGLYVLQIVYWFFLVETRPEKKAVRLSVNQLFGQGGLKSQFAAFSSGSNGPNFQKCLCLQVASFSLAIYCLFGLARLQSKYILHEPLNFTPRMVGYFGATSNIVTFVSTLIINFFCFHWLKWKESTVLVLGNMGIVGYSLSIGFSRTTLTIYLCRLWALTYAASLPSIRSMISKMFAAGNQGKTFATLAFVESISGLISDVSLGAVYENTVNNSPSIVFFVISGFALVLFLVSILLVVYGLADNYKKIANNSEADSIDDLNQPSPVPS